jgi:alkyldihydroxyacetonephosphate synthase
MPYVRRMKWWGWGDEEVAFTHEGKPELAPFLERHLGIDVSRVSSSPIAFEDLDIPEARLAPELRADLAAAAGDEHVSVDPLDRLVHARGKCLRDLVRHRRGEIGRIPDVVVRPGDEAAVVALLQAALAADAVVIPFGGGSNISGSLEPPQDDTRTIVSVDVGRMDRVLAIDEAARLARVQAGATGPQLEEQLSARGWTLGHFPDSFRQSTLGGWIATRSSGMQSDKYGDVADLTRAVRVAMPAGVLATRPVPATSTGPSVREMILGSEGRLGIVCEATVHVHRVPVRRTILGYLFPTWADALAAMRDIAAAEVYPSVTRVSDANETQFSFATRTTPTPLDRVKSKALSEFLTRRRDFDLEAMCLAFIGYEGSARHVGMQRRLVGRIVGRHGGVGIGSGPGALYDQKKFDTPYIRDYLLDRGALADVSETAAPWSLLPVVYDTVVAAARGAFGSLGVPGWIMCHLSHSYHSGACLYFTFALVPSGQGDPLDEYGPVKSAIQQAFLDSGATLSHHHAVGTEHAEWLEQDISAPGTAMLRALFDGVDPGGQLNPGKIV